MGAWLNFATFGAREAARICAEHPGILICGTSLLPYLLFGFLVGGICYWYAPIWPPMCWRLLQRRH